MKTKIMLVLSVFACLLVLQSTTAICAESSGAPELVGLLTNQLGITESQASGGAGALFQMAKGSLPESDYLKVAEAIPGIDTLIQSAPAVSSSNKGVSGQIDGFAKGLGSITRTADNVNKMAMVTDQFSKLGLDPGMVSQFIPIILNYANSKGGETVMNLLKSVWQ